MYIYIKRCNEIGFKSSFDELVVEKTFEAKKNGQEWITTTFQDTPRMSTYVLALAVGNYKSKIGTFMSGSQAKKLTVYASASVIKKCQFALEFALEAITYIESYLNVSYSLPKLDIIVIKSDQFSSALESWGVIIFNESGILVGDPAKEWEQTISVGTIISHALAHQWFGDLVTMEWWTELFLSEGFAAFMQYKVTNKLHSEWKRWQEFVASTMHDVMLMDSVPASPMQINPVIFDPGETILPLFDKDVYRKGSVILRMAQFFLGGEVFRRGVSNYLEKYSFGTASTEELWDELDLLWKRTGAGKKNRPSVLSALDTWMRQCGFPYINISRHVDNSKQFTAHQKIFILDPEMEGKSSSSPYNYVWNVPLLYTTSSGKRNIVWLKGDKPTTFVVKELGSASDWIKFNEQQSGYYLINYDKMEWKKFIKILKHKPETFVEFDRANLLFDCAMLAQGGLTSYGMFLEMTTYMIQKEEHYLPWATVNKQFKIIMSVLDHPDTMQALRVHIRNITHKMYTKLNWKYPLSHSDSTVQKIIVEMACFGENEDCLRKSRQAIKMFREGKRLDVSHSLETLAFCFGLAYSKDDADWEAVWNGYLKAKTYEAKKAMLFRLTCTRNEAKIKKLLGFLNDLKVISKEHAFFVITSLAENPRTLPFIWQYVQDNWDELTQRYPSAREKKYLENVIYLFQRFKKKVLKNADMSASEALQIYEESDLKKKILKDIKDFLSKHYSLPWMKKRLPQNVVPMDYDLTIEPNLTTNVFTGNVSISLMAKGEVQFFVLHAEELTVTNVKVLEEKTMKEIAVRDFFLSKKNKYLVIPLQKVTSGGDDSFYMLQIDFFGKFNLNMKGMYKSTYVVRKSNGSQEVRVLATTDFEPYYARTAFPCFDEPSFKAVFKIKIVHNSSLTALSNMPVEKKIRQGDLMMTIFEKTVSMSTYLVCMIVCDFAYTSGETRRGVKVKVHAPAYEVAHTQFALEVAVKALDFYEDYFNISYPLAKLDNIGIPDYNFEAMENWGLVTYKESVLVLESAPYSEKISSALVIVHELAHQWFGNLVTLDWWDNLWLNEGFASYMESKLEYYTDATWDTDHGFLVDTTAVAMLADSTDDVHPIIADTDDRDITDLFDSITYLKGASLLQSMEFFMGSEAFQRGVRDYLKAFAYRNARTDDLWQYMNKAYAGVARPDSGSIKEIMDTWTRQIGFPCIDVERKGNGVILLTQKRFLRYHAKGSSMSSPYNFTWRIPLSYRTRENAKLQPNLVWMNKKTLELKVNNLGNSDWIKFNANGKGFYLVNYKEGWHIWKKVLEDRHLALKAVDRATLIHNAFLLSQAGLLPYSHSLSMTTYLPKEKHYLPLITAWNALKYIYDLVEDTSTQKHLETYMDYISRGAVKKFSWKDTGRYRSAKLREVVVNFAFRGNNSNFRTQLVKEFAGWLSGRKLEPDLKELIYCYGMEAIGNQSVWDKVLKKYANERFAGERRILLKTLSCVANRKILERYMQLAWDDTFVRSQDYNLVFRAVLSNPFGLQAGWRYFKTHWKNYIVRFGSASEYLQMIAYKFKTTKQLEELRKFLNDLQIRKVEAKEFMMRGVKFNIEWLKMYKNEIENWLKEMNKKSTN